jgi:lysozyme
MNDPIVMGAEAGKAFRPIYADFKNGIDVSHHNGDIDWHKVKEIGIPNPDGSSTLIDFAYIKITEGTKGRDPKALVNASGASMAGIPIGAYHFCTLDRKDVVADATEEANYLVNRLLSLPEFQMPIALDIELDNKSLKLNPGEFLNWIKTFYAGLGARGYNDRILYSYSWYLQAHLPKDHDLGDIRLWIADYDGTYKLPNGWTRAFMHQYSNKGKVAGIATLVDLNRIL